MSIKQKIGIIGYGNVGKALVKQCAAQAEFEIAGIAVKNPQKHRDISKDFLVANALELIGRHDVKIILEAIDNEADALLYAAETLTQGKIYITASKKMLANNLPKLLLLAREFQGQLFFEAAVGGAIPIIRTIETALKNQEITKVRGILNGTCNYILTQMSSAGLRFETALSHAKRNGFAESKPDSDIEGQDAYFKAYILASVLAGGQPDLSRLKVEGISGVSELDIDKAKRRHEKIKLIVEIERRKESFTIDIGPKSINDRDGLYFIENETNAIEIEGPNFQKLCLIGPGAGGAPTASAMISDLINASKATKLPEFALLQRAVGQNN